MARAIKKTNEIGPNGLKVWNNEFTTVLSVNVLGEQLLNSFLPKNPTLFSQWKDSNTISFLEYLEEFVVSVEEDAGLGSDLFSMLEEAKKYLANHAYFATLTETIIDGIHKRDSKCAALYNALNGWVKMPTPFDEQQEEIKKRIRYSKSEESSEQEYNNH